MAVAEELRVLIRAEVADAAKNLKTFKNEAKATHDQAVKLAQGVASAGKSMLSTVGVPLSVAAGLKLLYDAAGDAVKAFHESEDAATLLDQALINTGIYSETLRRDLEGLAKELQNTTRFEGDATIAAAGMLQQLADLSGEGLKEILPLIADFAAATGKDMKTAAELVGKQLGTERDALKAYGIEIGDAATKEEELALVTDALRDKFGGMAAAMGANAAGKAEILKNNMGDLGEIVGGFISKRAEPMMDFISQFAAAAVNAATGTKDLQGEIDKLKPPRSFLTMIADEVKGYEKEIKDIEAAIRNATDKKVTTGGFTVTIPKSEVVKQLKEDLANRKSYYESRKQFALDIGAIEAKVAVPGGKGAKEAIKDAIKFTDALSVGVNNAKTTWEALDIIIQDIAPHLNDVKAEARQATDAMSLGLMNAKTTWEALGIIIQDIPPKIDDVVDKVEEMKEQIREAIMSIMPVFSAMGEAMLNSADGWEIIKEAATDAIASMIEALGQKAITQAVDAFMSMNPIAGAGWTAAAAAAYAAAGAVRSLDNGGTINEPVLGVGMQSGQRYGFAMNGPENFGGVHSGYGGGGTAVQSTNVTQHFHIAGSVWTTKQLQDLAVRAVVGTGRI